MVPASYAYSDFTYTDPNTGIIEILDQAADYYYACLTSSGGVYDDFQDVMYGRLSVGNETELSNCVNKIISYEANSNGSWTDKTTFVSFSPDLWNSGGSDDAMETNTGTIPSAYQRSYAYRAYTTDPATLVTQASPIYGQRFTSAQYNDPNNLCGADLLDNWVYDDPTAGLNSGIHTFVYEGHGGALGFGAEGCGRRILGLNYPYNCDASGNTIYNKLHNTLYTFMIFNACQTGEFDDAIEDCEAEQIANLANAGAIGVLASTRSSYASAFGVVDGYVLQAMYSSLSHIMGEAVMESKLSMSYVLFRRQYNLYGDPAVNLWPTGYTVTQNLTLSGTDQISDNITVASGVTLTISPGTTLQFKPGVSLTINESALKSCGLGLDFLTN